MIGRFKITKQEEELLYEYPQYAPQTSTYALKAGFETNLRYLDHQDGTSSNAFLHAYWSALLAKNISEEWAYLYTNAHESETLPENAHFSDMDFFNNDLGIQTAKVSSQLSNDELANRIEELIDTGMGRRLKSKKLVATTKENKRSISIFEAIFLKALSILIKLHFFKNMVNKKNEDGMTPLIYATNLTFLDGVKLLVNHSDLEAQDNLGNTAIFYASKNENIEFLKVLIDAGANINTQDLFYKMTPLMEAVSSRNVKNAQLLIQAGADISLKSAGGFTAYDIAKLEGSEELFSFLKPTS